MKIKIFILSFSIAGFVCNSFGQNQNKIDSLLNVLKTAKEDTTKVNTLIALGWELNSSNPDTSIILGNQALSLSEKAASRKHIANSYHVIAKGNYAKGNYPSALDNNLKALSLREELGDKLGISKSLGNIGNVYFEQGNYPKALDYYSKALKMDEELGNKKGIAIKLFNIGNVYIMQGNYPKALHYYFKTLKMDEEHADKVGIAFTLGSIGNVYSEQGDYPKALDYYFQALKMNEELGNKRLIAANHSNIGVVYHNQKDYNKALDYSSKALKMSEELGSKKEIAANLSNIGLVYYDQGDNPKALDYYFKALKINVELGNKNGIATTLGNIGLVYLVQKDYPKALNYYFKALNIAEELEAKKRIAIQLGNIGLVYTETGKFPEAEDYLKKAIAIADNIGAMNKLWEFEERLSQIYDTTGRYKLALEHYKKAIVLKDTLFNQEKNKEITRKEMNYEFEKTQAIEKVEHEKHLAVADVEIKKQKLLKYSFIGGLGVIIILLLFGYRVYRAQQLLRLQNIRNKISGDLHDDIGSTLNSISIYSEVARKKDEKQDEALEMIGDASRKIIDAMSDIVWTINPENDSFAKIIFRMKSLAYNLFRAMKIEFTFHADEILNEKKLSLEERRNFYLIFKEAINNLVKYANATRASITLSNENDCIKLRIQDDGVGFDMTEDTAGNGLKNMKRRADEIKAQFKIESKKGNGTQIELILKA